MIFFYGVATLLDSRFKDKFFSEFKKIEVDFFKSTLKNEVLVMSNKKKETEMEFHDSCL